LSQPLVRVEPGRWEARFAPDLAGHYTGTVVVARGEEREIGLVPLITVHPSGRRGFVRALALGGRMFECSAGGLFPMGVDLQPAEAANLDWAAELARLRAQGVNY